MKERASLVSGCFVLALTAPHAAVGFTFSTRRLASPRVRSREGTQVRGFRMSSTSPASAAAATSSAAAGRTPIPPGSRALGTQENLFAPRQYLLNEGAPFPPLAHICSVTLSSRDGAAVSPEELKAALAWAIGSFGYSPKGDPKQP